ncbi:hypothetical protein VFPBJ_05184 [Purpureocillium lilacinum]|uniref:Uncharacterized protein n=1 Tax=Purpureocillium lilacinum TaxID=33203 RepID=A0A179GR33_PURLI|nr:hypothetical protein VFPBJ_05184 [Purpureocillium lilacinum]
MARQPSMSSIAAVVRRAEAADARQRAPAAGMALWPAEDLFLVTVTGACSGDTGLETELCGNREMRL